MENQNNILKSSVSILSMALILLAITASTACGIVGGGTHYPGVAASYVRYPHDAAFKPSDEQFTIEAWVHLDDIDAGKQIIISKMEIGQGWAMGFAPGNFVRFFDSPAHFTESTLAVPPMKWTHVAVTYSPNGATFYVNGIYAGSQPPGQLPIENIEPLTIGSDRTGSAGAAFHGCLDEIRLWDTYRSQADIRTDMYRSVLAAPGLLAAIPDGGANEVVSGLVGSIHGEIKDCDGFIVEYPVFDVKSVGDGDPVNLDGVPGDGEYPGTDTLILHYQDVNVPRDGIVHLVHSEKDLFIGVDFTRASMEQTSPFKFGIFIHPQGMVENVPSTSDMAIFVDDSQKHSLLFFGDGKGNYIPCEETPNCPDPDTWEVKIGYPCAGDQSGPCVEIRISKELLNTKPGETRIALGHFGFSGPNEDPENPIFRMAPGTANWKTPFSWQPLSFALPQVTGTGSCEDPILLPSPGDLPVIYEADFINGTNNVENISCLPLPHPGPELYLNFTPAKTGQYLIVVRPMDEKGNVALILSTTCPPEDNSCLAGADSEGAGKLELIELELQAQTLYTICVDGSFGQGGQELNQVEVRVELIPSPGLPSPGEMILAKVMANKPGELDNIRELMLNIWEEDVQNLIIFGEILKKDAIVLSQAGLIVDQYEPEKVKDDKNEARSSLSFNRFRYDTEFNNEASLSLYTNVVGLPAVQQVYVVSETTKDVEIAKLNLHGDHFASNETLKLSGESSEEFDGVLSVNPGDLLLAVWQDPRLPGDPEGTAAGLAMIKGRKPLGLVSIDVDPELKPPVAETPGHKPGEPPRPLGVIAGDAGARLILGTDQAIVAPRSDEELEDIIVRYDATVTDNGTLPGLQENPEQLIRFNPGTVDTDDIEATLELLGAKGSLRISSPEVRELLVLFAEERLRGATITPNIVFEFHGQPMTNEEGGTWNTFTNNYVSDCLQGLQRAWMYMDLMDQTVADGNSPVRVAVIDSNFCRDIEDEVSVVGGYNIYADSADPFGRASIFGLGGPFHGTQMASVVGGHLQNRVGAAGSGGQVSELLLYNIGGLSYLFDAAKGIRLAVRDGAEVINMSLGFPCQVAGLNFCNPSTAFLCPFIGPFLDSAFTIISPFIPLPPGTGGFLCDVIVGIMSATENSLESAISLAEAAGVSVVASAGNKTDLTGQGTVEEYHIIPAVLDNVIAVGVTNADYENTEFHGSSVDVWVLEAPADYSPLSDGDCPPFIVRNSFGTSSGAAYVSGVVAMMRAVNPLLNARQVRDILAMSVVGPPGTDRRVRRFLRSDIAVMTAGNDPVGTIVSPILFGPSFAFDEDDGTMSGDYGDITLCDGWPPVIRIPADTKSDAINIPIPLLSTWRGTDFGIHDFGPNGDQDHDWFKIIPEEDPDGCTTFSITMSTEYLTQGGQLEPVVEIPGTMVDIPGAITSRSQWTGTGLFMIGPLYFQVSGDDNLYNLEVSASPTGTIAGDRLEFNNTFESRATFPVTDFVETVDRDFIEYTFTLSDLNFNCADDVDFISIPLPNAVEDCFEPEDSCGLGTALGGLTQLIISAPGVLRIALYNDAGEELTSARSLIRITCPRSLGYENLHLSIKGNTAQYLEYELTIRYRVLADVADGPEISDALMRYLCCELSGFHPCGERPEPGESSGGPDSTGIEFWSPAFETPQFFEFNSFCPQLACDPVPSLYQRIDWAGGNTANFGMLLGTPLMAENRFVADLLNEDHDIVGQAEPQFQPNERKGGNDEQLLWELAVKDLPEGIYYLRIRGLEQGEIYSLENIDPLPSLSVPQAPTNMKILSVSANTVSLTWKDNADNEAQYQLERKGPDDESPVLIATLLSDTENYVDTGLPPDTEYLYLLRAVNAAGPSAPDVEIVVSTGKEETGPKFKRGDGNSDGNINIADASFVLSYLFSGTAKPDCFDSTDANDDGNINLADAIAVLSFLFGDATSLADPFTSCGEDPTEDGLGCDFYFPCLEINI